MHFYCFFITHKQTLRAYFGGAWEKGGDNWYRDGLTDQKYRYVNTYYDETSYNLRVDYDINKEHTVTLAYNHMDAHDGYPLTAPYRKYMTAEEWARIKKDYFENDKYGNTNNPGYRNLWYMWAWTGGYTAFKKNDINLTYSFGNDGPIERFVRVYHQDGSYWGSFGGGDDPNAPTPDTPEWYEWAKKNYRSQDWKSWYSKERNEGVQVQWGKVFGAHQIITSWTLDSSHYQSWSRKKNAFANTDRKTVWGFVQDKISLNDKWQVTPALRYTRTGSVKKYTEEGKLTSTSDSASVVTGALATQYALSDSLTAYASWSQVYRPLKASDYNAKNGSEIAHLRNEEGNVWTAGIRKNWGDLYFNANYSKTDMSNAVARISVKEKGATNLTTKFFNAKQDKEAVNFSLQKKLDKHWSAGLSYTYMKDKWTAKELGEAELIINETYGNINTAINQLRPANFYMANISYENKNFFADCNVNWYTGCSTIAFTSKRFLVMDLNMNYKLKDNVNVYASINNVTDEAWETTYTPYLAIGAWPQPARHYMMGVTYKF
ncbi:MAG: TonB-dependent receptor [Veillonellaceae bacterium]|nr:TonB-dependent receptor [Veillonellaceae bacterium]